MVELGCFDKAIEHGGRAEELFLDGRVNRNVAKAGGNQSQGAKGDVSQNEKMGLR